MDDDDAERPFFAEQSRVAQRIMDAQLVRGGYETPLATPIADAALHKAYLAILVGEMTRTYSQREAWMKEFAQWGLDYVTAIGDGETSVEGGEVDEDPPITGLSVSTFAEVSVFDGAGAASRSVYANLGPGPRGLRRRW